MYFENFVLEATERVLAWEISDEALSQAVSDQASLMARIGSDQFVESCVLDHRRAFNW